MSILLDLTMATSFGNSKKAPSSGPSAIDMLRLYNQENPAADYQIRKIKDEALTNLTTTWFNDNPQTLKNTTSWSQLMCKYLDHTSYDMDSILSKPLASYLNFIMTLDAKKLIVTLDKHSPRYDTFREVIDILAPSTAMDVHRALQIIARDGSVDLHKFMQNMQSMCKSQIDYDEYVLDDEGSYKDTPAGKFMHALVGLSFLEVWKMPDDEMYHSAWDVLEESDLECYTETYEAYHDVVAHLTTTLPSSTYAALDYYHSHGNKLIPGQTQQIFSMSLSNLEFPDGFEKLLDVLYYSESGNQEETQKIFSAVNPAATIFSTLIALYDNPDDVIQDSTNHVHIKEMIAVADASRTKENTTTLVENLNIK